MVFKELLIKSEEINDKRNKKNNEILARAHYR